VLALLLGTIGVYSVNQQASAASDKLKVTALLIEDRDRTKACKGSFTQATVDYAIWKKGNPKVTGNVDRVAYWDEQCLIKVISNKSLSGTQYLQVKQETEWVDICSVSFWAKQLSKRDCSQKFGGKENLGKVSGKNIICTFKNACIGSYDYSTPSLGVYTRTEGDFCLETSISNLELRVRVVSGKNQYISNSVTFSYLNTDKVINQGDKCVLATSSSSSGKSPGQGSTSGTSGTSLPQCSVTQIRQHSALAKSFNEWRNMYLDSVALMNESINGMNKTFISGNQTAYEGWSKNLVDSTALARSTATDAIDTQNKLISLMQQCSFNYGIIVTQPYGFITTDESRRGYQFPTFQIP
jgi:hypothetical protein